MSLRVRLITSIVLVLLISICFSGAVGVWHAVRSVRTEMQAALAVSAQTLWNGIDDLPNALNPRAELERLVHMFDGDRHVRVTLCATSGGACVTSIIARLSPDVPAWLVALSAPSIAPVQFDAGDGCVFRIATDPRNEIGEVWTQLQDDLVAAGLSCGLSVVLVSLVVGRALRPLDRLSAALALLGSGHYTVRVEHAGPPELLRLGQGFNLMVERLQESQARNLRLSEQLLTLQDEERTDIARDLHDEVGAFLFAVHLDAASIEQASKSGSREEVAERALAIREAVSHMQRHVRAMLHRLRPASPIEVGLTPALANLVAFWRARQTGIDFMLDVSGDEDLIGEPTMATIYRLVQEAVNNSVRHGQPSWVEIVVRVTETGAVLARVTDNGAGITTCNEPGLGLTGMRERVQALGGTLCLEAGRDGTGTRIVAALPASASTQEA